MTYDKLLATLKEHRITLKIEGDKIAVKGNLTKPLRSAIIAHKPELIRHLQDENHDADDGYGEKYWTGKECIIEGCTKPAGTGWGPLWCKDHDIERRNRVTRQMEDLLTQFDPTPVVPTPTEHRLQHALTWFKKKTLKIPMADRGRQKAKLTLPLRFRWLMNWMPEEKLIELETEGVLPWTDFDAVMKELCRKFERD